MIRKGRLGLGPRSRAAAGSRFKCNNYVYQVSGTVINHHISQLEPGFPLCNIYGADDGFMIVSS
jgi:hypothetical protein